MILNKYSPGDSPCARGLRVGIKEMQSSWQNRCVMRNEFSRLHIESVTLLGGKPEAQATTLSLKHYFFSSLVNTVRVFGTQCFSQNSFTLSKNSPLRATALLILTRKDKYVFEIFLSMLSKISVQVQKAIVHPARHLCAAQWSTVQNSLAVQGCAPPSDPRRLCPSPRPHTTCLSGQKPSQMGEHVLCRACCSSYGAGPIPALSHPKWREELVQSAFAGGRSGILCYGGSS